MFRGGRKENVLALESDSAKAFCFYSMTTKWISQQTNSDKET